MARYLRMNGDSIGPDLILISGNSLPFKIHGHGPDRKHLLIKSSSTSLKVLPVAVNHQNIEQRLKFEVQKVVARTPVTIRAYTQNGDADLRTMVLNVVLLPLLELPSVDSEEGILVRVLLLENVAPSNPKFVSQSETLLAMQWMRHVLMNRLKFGPKYFGAGNANNLSAFIKAPNQVDGFESYPTLTVELSIRLADIIKIANDGSDKRYSACREHVQNALDVVNGAKAGSDPCPAGLYAWRTADARSPGANFVKYQTRGGQDFYTLTQEFRTDPLLKNRQKP
jgi:hypothetical protein